MRAKYILIALTASVLSGSGSAVVVAGTETAHLTESDVQASYSLGGQWRFRPGDDLSWASPDYDDSSWAERRITKLWPPGGYPESRQFAWYRQTLQFDLHRPEIHDYLSRLGVRLGKVMSAYELYAGGELVGGVGKLPPMSEIDYDSTRVFLIPPSALADDGTLVLALRVWGGTELAVSKWGGGPYERDFSIGDYAQLLQASFLSEIPGLLASVLFLGFGFYHVYLYQRNRQLRTYLWYGLLALVIGTYARYVTLRSSRWGLICWSKYVWCCGSIMPAIRSGMPESLAI